MISRVESRMLTSIPEEWQATMQRIDVINQELRCTDIRLLNNPTDEQIEHFCSIILEGQKAAGEIDVDAIEAIIGPSLTLRNYIHNFQEVCRTQSVAAGYAWRAHLKRISKEKDIKYEGDIAAVFG